LASISLSTAKPRRKKEFLDESPATKEPSGTSAAHLAPNERNYKFFINKRLRHGTTFRKRLSGGRNCAERENFPVLTSWNGGIVLRFRLVDAEFTTRPGRLEAGTHVTSCGKLYSTCPESWLIRKLIAEDTSLRGRDHFIVNASPASFARDQGHGKIHKVEKRDENAEDDVDPRLAHDLRARCR
jgi:hypothetical protein